MKKLFILTLIFSLVISFTFPYFLTAQDTSDSAIADLNSKIDEYQKKINDLSRAKDTLGNQITLLNSQIQLTTLKISQTQANIKTLISDIASLTTKISELDVSLNQLSSVYIEQVSQNYKMSKRYPQLSFLLNPNFNRFLEQYKYIATVQKNSQDSLVAMETTRTNFNLQKDEKAKKQAELQNLTTKLADQQNSLDKQKIAKNNLLESTKNDEKVYQQKLQEALAQLSAMKNFSSSSGSSCLTSSPGSGSDGFFYSQRDPSWCRQHIGLSNDTLGEVGCYISSVSMVYKKLGSSMSPSLYASNPGNFYGTTAYMNTPSAPSGYTFKQVSYNTTTIDNELAAGRFVIAQISMKSVSGMHFIVIISGSKGSYKIHDPWFGPDLNFSDRYSPSSVMSLRLFTK